MHDKKSFPICHRNDITGLRRVPKMNIYIDDIWTKMALYSKISDGNFKGAL